MTYKVLLHGAVPKEIRALPAPTRERVKAAIDGLASNPVPIGAARLHGRPHAYRLRFGDYRLVYEVHAAEIVVYVVGLAHRKEVYQRLLRRRQVSR